MNKVITWFKTNRLIVNYEKTHFVPFHSKYSHVSNALENINITIDSHTLYKCNNVNFLGIHIDKYLQWNTHIEYVNKKVSKCVGILNKLKYYVPLSALVTLYNSLILPYLSYCVPVWGNCNQSKMNSLIKLQKKSVRICTGSQYLDHTAPLFKKLNILVFDDLYSYHTALLGFYYFQNLLPFQISQMFCINCNVHRYNTRNSNFFHLFRVNSTFVKKSVRFSFPVVWNSIPSDIRSYKNLRLFKKSLKRYFVCKYSS